MYIEELKKELSERQLAIWNGTSGLSVDIEERYRKLWRNSVLENQIVASYVINLKRRPDRLTNVLEQMTKASIDPFVFEAVDGYALPLPENWNYGGGAYGCLESHKRVLEHAMINNLKCIAVYEDDAIFVEDFQQKLKFVMSICPDDFEMIYLGGQHRKTPLSVKEGIVRCGDCHRTHAYIVRQPFMKRLYQIWSSNQGHADHILAKHFNTIKAYACDPWLVGQSESKSDINNRHQSERWWDTKKK